MSEQTTTTTAPGDKLLEVDDVTIKFGGLTALDAVTFDIKRGEILGLIGPNGAGKTTCFNVMTGVYQATSGQVRLDGKPLAKMKRHEITRLGMARTFQNIRLFKSMTVLENVMVGADAHSKVGFFDALLRTPRHRRTEEVSLERAKELCRGCPAQDWCLDGALDRGEPWGVWGGQIVIDGAVVHNKRGPGRPRKNAVA